MRGDVLTLVRLGVLSPLRILCEVGAGLLALSASSLELEGNYSAHSNSVVIYCSPLDQKKSSYGATSRA